MPRGMRLPVTDSLLIWILAGGLGLGVLVVLLVVPDTKEPAGLSPIAATLQPEWSDQPEPVTVSKQGNALEIYLDVSHPMGGFLPPTSLVSSPPGLSEVTQLLPGYLVRGYKGPIRWKTVATKITPLPKTPQFDRPLFRGSETLLEPAVEEMLTGLESGRLAAAVLVTDMVATGGPESAMGVARPLSGWLRSPAVRAGLFDAGVLGVRTNYWGVQASSCSAQGELGCWYSEQADRYYPLPKVVKRPFYVIILGRTDQDPELVDRLGRQLREELEGLGLETQWERFHEERGTRSANLDCSLYDEEAQPEAGQFILVKADNGSWKCLQDKPVKLECRLKLSEGGATLPLIKAEVSWPWVKTWIDDEQFLAIVDCSHWRSRPPNEDLRFKKLSATASFSSVPDWSSWTAFSDQRIGDLHGTLQLGLFMEEVRIRPESYRVELAAPLLKVK